MDDTAPIKFTRLGSGYKLGFEEYVFVGNLGEEELKEKGLFKYFRDKQTNAVYCKISQF